MGAVFKTIWVAVLLGIGHHTMAMTSPEIEVLKFAILKESPLEVPAFVGKTISRFSPQEREAVSLEILKAVIDRNENLVVPTVAAMSKTAPELALKIAVFAVELAPRQAKSIVRAVMAAAPAEAARIRRFFQGVGTASSGPAEINRIPIASSPGLSMNERLSGHTLSPTSGTVIVGNAPINTVNRTGPGGNAFPPNTIPPGSREPGFPWPPWPPCPERLPCYYGGRIP